MKMHNILVTGASKGIGNVIAKELLQLGNVFISGRNENALKSFGAKSYCVCDLAENPEILGDFIERNKIDILINNAG